MEYVKRNIVELLLPKIEKEHIIAVTGARQTGKTTLCEDILPSLTNLSHTYISFDDPDERLRFQDSGITILEAIDSPLVILDEVQKIPLLFDPLKYVVDKQKRRRRSKKQTFIITGSSQLVLMKGIKETLAGRVSLLNLFPFSLSELLNVLTAPLLPSIWKEKGLKDSHVKQVKTMTPAKMRKAIQITKEHQAWGGYPPVWQKKDRTDKLNWLQDYRKTYLERDIFDVGQVANLDVFSLAQKLLCARSGQILSISEVARDLSLAVNTVKRYINLLELTFQCFLLYPYFENVGKRFIKSPKIFFPDPGLNKVILGEMSINTGAAYESWVFSELIKWKHLQAVEPELYFYRTAGGMEIDFLIAGERMILPIEAKSSANVSHADGRNLASFMVNHKKVAPIGIVVYPGKVLKEIRKDIWAIPDWLLFGGC
ncbi:MAG: ATP-binding protein [Thermodesulfobacteriota bacterium]